MNDAMPPAGELFVTHFLARAGYLAAPYPL